MKFKLVNSEAEKEINPGEQEISRRRLIKIGLVAAAASIVPYNSFAAAKELLNDERRICIYNLHTKEQVDTVFWKDGSYIPEALKELNHIFRDHYNGSERLIKRDLFNLLYAIQRKLQCNEPFQLISGYRSRSTNEMLRQRNKGVSRRSLHMRGMAADIRLPGDKLKTLRKAAFELQKGGVGYYPRSNFVHLDVGNVRFWRG